MTDYEHFQQLDIRVGTVLSATLSPKARIPAYVLTVDFGSLGTRTTSAQLTQNYTPNSLVGQQIVAVVNFPPKRVAGVQSQVLVLAAVSKEQGAILLKPDVLVDNGNKIV